MQEKYTKIVSEAGKENTPQYMIWKETIRYEMRCKNKVMSFEEKLVEKRDEDPRRGC